MAAPRKVEAVISGIRQFEGGVTLYTLKTEMPLRFKPGQFLHLAIDPYDPSFNWPESRVFSIASPPNGSEELEILISPKGTFTRRMVAELKTGDHVWIKLPFGVFNFDASHDKHIVLIAGGTGISPFISFLNHQLLHSAVYKSLNLYYGVRKPGLIIYDELILACEKSLGNFHSHIYCENAGNYTGKGYHDGALPVGNIVKETCSLPGVLYYLSGPKGMIEAFEQKLLQHNVPAEQVIYDRWE